MTDFAVFKTLVGEIPDHDCTLDTIDIVDQLLYGNDFLSRRKRCAKDLQRYLLVSRSHPYTQRMFKSSNSIVREIVRHLKVAPSTIHPLSMFRSNWEIAMVIYYYLYFICVPYFTVVIAHHIGDFMEGEREIVGMEFFYLAILAFGYVEIIVNFFSGYVTSDAQLVVLDKRGIARRYFSTFFFPDMIAILPYGIFFRVRVLHHDYWYLQLLCTIKLLRVISLMNYSKQISKRFNIRLIVRRIVLLLALMCLYLHWAACAILFSSELMTKIHEKSETGKKSWAQRIGTYKLNKEEIYRACLLRAISYTFGTNNQFNYSEIADLFVNILCFILGFLISIYCAVQIVVTSRTSRAGSTVFEKMQSELRSYLAYKRVPRRLNRRICHYFRFRYERTYYDESVIMRFLPGHLRQELLLYKSLQLMDTVDIFRNLPPVLAIRIVSCTKEQVALRNEVVVFANTPSDIMFYIISGTIAIFNKMGNEVCHLLEGAHFGEAALLMDDVTSEVSAVALETTRLWTLTRRAFCTAMAPDKQLLKEMEHKFRGRVSSKTARRNQQRKVVELVQHLRDTHRAAQTERRRKIEQNRRFKSMMSHEPDDSRQSMPNTRRRRMSSSAITFMPTTPK